MTSRWFPWVLALVQLVRHVAFLAYDYWFVAQNERGFDIAAFICRDLSRPLFEPSAFCGAWVSYLPGQTANIGLDLPAYYAAGLFHSVVTLQMICEDQFTLPRGQLFCLPFVAAIWMLTGMSIRRFAQRRWRRRTENRWSRMFVSIGLLALPICALCLLWSLVALFTSGVDRSLRLLGLGSWMLYLSLLSAERLRVWPFSRISD